MELLYTWRSRDINHVCQTVVLPNPSTPHSPIFDLSFPENMYYNISEFTNRSRFLSILFSIIVIPGMIDLPLRYFDWTTCFLFANMLLCVSIRYDVYCCGCCNLENYVDLMITRAMWCAGLFISWILGLVVYEVGDYWLSCSIVEQIANFYVLCFVFCFLLFLKNKNWLCIFVFLHGIGN